MNDNVARLVQHMRALEEELEAEFDKQRRQFHYRIERNRVRFEAQARDYQRRLRKGVLRYLAGMELRDLIAAPFIYAMIVPFVLLDISLAIYQLVICKAYGIPRVRRSDFIVIDRHNLAYLNGIEKLNCVYCGYGNGLASYAKVIASRTEQFWCPIKHARRVAQPHSRYPRFFDYGDADSYREGLEALRENLVEHKTK